MRLERHLTPPLAGFVAGVMLAPERTSLLRACLFDGAAWKEAWRIWFAEVGDPKAFFGGDGAAAKGLLPLLFDAAQRLAIPFDASFQTYLRTAYLRERVRTATYTRICGDILAALADASIEVIPLRGNALAESVYAAPWLRHSHGLDLLLRRSELVPRATGVLAARGLVVAPEAPQPEGDRVRFAHPSGLTVCLQADLFDHADHAVPVDELWATSEIRRIAGAPARGLAPADALFEVCGRAWLSPTRANLNWLCDAWLLIRRYPDLDWTRLAELGPRARLALPLIVAIGYLAGSLAAPVPCAVLDRLAAAARTDPSTAGHYLIEARRSFPRGPVALLRRIRGWRNRLLVAADLVWPSPEYLRLAYGATGRGRLLWLNLRRPWVYAIGALVSAVRQWARGARGPTGGA